MSACDRYVSPVICSRRSLARAFVRFAYYARERPSREHVQTRLQIATPREREREDRAGIE